jgi:hypothetical protein
MGAIVADRAASHGGPAPEAFVYGLTFGMKVSAIICLGAALAAAVFVRHYRHHEEAEQHQQVEVAA